MWQSWLGASCHGLSPGLETWLLVPGSSTCWVSDLGSPFLAWAYDPLICKMRTVGLEAL